MREEIRNQVVAETIAFLNRGPERVSSGIEVDRRGIAETGREKFAGRAIRVALPDSGSLLRTAGIGVRFRTDAEI